MAKAGMRNSSNCRTWNRWHAMATWIALEHSWEKTKEALQLITPEGELHTRAQAKQVLAERLPELPDQDFAKVKKAVQKAEMLNYLDHVHKQLAELPFAAEV